MHDNAHEWLNWSATQLLACEASEQRVACVILLRCYTSRQNLLWFYCHQLHGTPIKDIHCLQQQFYDSQYSELPKISQVQG